MSNNIGWI